MVTETTLSPPLGLKEGACGRGRQEDCKDERKQWDVVLCSCPNQIATVLIRPAMPAGKSLSRADLRTVDIPPPPQKEGVVSLDPHLIFQPLLPVISMQFSLIEHGFRDQRVGCANCRLEEAKGRGSIYTAAGRPLPMLSEC